MSKVILDPNEVKLAGSTNFHLRKYMITRIVKLKKLWDLLSPSLHTSLQNKKDSRDSNIDDSENRAERLMLILTMSIRPSMLAVLTDYHEPKRLREFLKGSFENVDDNRKCDLKNRLQPIPFSKNLGA